MEHYEQGKLLFEKARETKSALLGTSLDFYLASAEAFNQAHDKLAKENPHVSDVAGKLAFHLYRHCTTNTDKNSDIHVRAMEQLKTFSF
jgi:hypothetical protein